MSKRSPSARNATRSRRGDYGRAAAAAAPTQRHRPEPSTTQAPTERAGMKQGGSYSTRAPSRAMLAPPARDSAPLVDQSVARRGDSASARPSASPARLP